MATKKAPKKAAKKVATSKKTKKAPVKLGDPKKTFDVIKDHVDLISEDIEKFTINGVKSAGRRVRGNAQVVKKACMQMRKEIQAMVRTMKAEKAK